MKVADGNYLFDNDINAVLAALEGKEFVLSGLAVTEWSTPDMTVQVAAGTYCADGTVVVKASATQVSLSAAHGTLYRKDLIVGDSAGTLSSVTGVAATRLPTDKTGPQTYQPAPPDIPSGKVILAEVWVEPAETTILDADITDRRVFAPEMSMLEYVEQPADFSITAGAGVWQNTNCSDTIDLPRVSDLKVICFINWRNTTADRAFSTKFRIDLDGASQAGETEVIGCALNRYIGTTIVAHFPSAAAGVRTITVQAARNNVGDAITLAQQNLSVESVPKP